MIARYAELAYCRAIPDLLHAKLKNSRLKNLYRKLQKAVDSDLLQLPQIDQSALLKIIEAFGDATGWNGQSRHVATLLSFALAIMEESEFNHNPRITELLVEIVNHYEQKEQFKPLCFSAGAIAAEKWRKIAYESYPQ